MRVRWWLALFVELGQAAVVVRGAGGGADGGWEPVILNEEDPVILNEKEKKEILGLLASTKQNPFEKT